MSATTKGGWAPPESYKGGDSHNEKPKEKEDKDSDKEAEPEDSYHIAWSYSGLEGFKEQVDHDWLENTHISAPSKEQAGTVIKKSLIESKKQQFGPDTKKDHLATNPETGTKARYKLSLEDNENAVTPEFRNFVSGSCFVLVALLITFIIMGTQGVVNASTAATIVGLLSVFVLGFGKKRYDLRGN